MNIIFFNCCGDIFLCVYVWFFFNSSNTVNLKICNLWFLRYFFWFFVHWFSDFDLSFGMKNETYSTIAIRHLKVEITSLKIPLQNICTYGNYFRYFSSVRKLQNFSKFNFTIIIVRERIKCNFLAVSFLLSNFQWIYLWLMFVYF